jgi:hypothetical protein
MAEQPNEASRKSKAEGDRWGDEESQAGISNRPLDEEISNQEALPPRGDSKPGGLDTPRRYDQPIEDDGDPVMPTDDATVNTKI